MSNSTPFEREFKIGQKPRALPQFKNVSGTTTEAQVSAAKGLLPFSGGEHQDKKQGVSVCLADCLELTDERAEQSERINRVLYPPGCHLS